MKLTKQQFFESLNWHDGLPPFFAEPENSQVPFYGIIYDEKVVAIKDKDGNMYMVGYFNNNLCMGMCDNCQDQENYDENYDDHGFNVQCIDRKEIVSWAEFYE